MAVLCQLYSYTYRRSSIFTRYVFLFLFLFSFWALILQQHPVISAVPSITGPERGIILIIMFISDTVNCYYVAHITWIIMVLKVALVGQITDTSTIPTYC